jgi:cold shock CspA family protein
VWAHHTAIEVTGFRTLAVAQRVTFEVLDLGGPIQDGYRYRAERILPGA